MRIDWELPPFREGWRGQIDRIIGPGATKAEINLQLYLPIVAIAIVVGIGLYKNYNWSLGQYLAASFLALDMVGGIITNLTSTAKRWNFRKGNGFKAHMSFIAIHAFQLFLVSYFFLNFDIFWIATIYGFLLLSCAFILKCPLYLQRTVSGIVLIVSLLLSIYVFKSPEHLEWFLPLFFYKLQVSHVVREEPYRPENA
ncbi:hypothetical protein [Acaryochloris sp. IP29b_bin.148]|uniref:hypothetical protein n=1 Tax=Acaryochloris sp. IP29b_bin.148 TaxID=2969218 RepID=UPI0034560AE5